MTFPPLPSGYPPQAPPWDYRGAMFTESQMRRYADLYLKISRLDMENPTPIRKQFVLELPDLLRLAGAALIAGLALGLLIT